MPHPTFGICTNMLFTHTHGKVLKQKRTQHMLIMGIYSNFGVQSTSWILFPGTNGPTHYYRPFLVSATLGGYRANTNRGRAAYCLPVFKFYKRSFSRPVCALPNVYMVENLYIMWSKSK